MTPNARVMKAGSLAVALAANPGTAPASTHRLPWGKRSGNFENVI